jgi:hypothetical protein
MKLVTGFMRQLGIKVRKKPTAWTIIHANKTEWVAHTPEGVKRIVQHLLGI